ncbi:MULTISPECIES: exonuclease domain-containing protein [unclassified Corynebacterium]|uniref:exonuclease domain-containing protein n=1 Tax=unclassified Corynebacterium TaxID=2624378 RepID=UPI0029CA76B5|nr:MULTISPECIES: exonuclease domain-containing protein [unclassified Corynebacterium]WPF66284.1 exonuclease domain-containing protein [Corynebacterium sp. 22KM0430]WPF68774.1 exonuclease domain-containing protein [Corynebacterium sp. 21KM1197]
MTQHDNEHSTAAPYVALTLQTTGIHPSTGRVVAVDAVVFENNGDIAEEFHAVVNPGPRTNLGPVHYHGLSPEDIEQGRRFGSLLKKLDKLIDGRTLIVHDTPLTWGFLVSEARRAMNAAARANRSRARGKGRGQGGRRRQRVGHVPRPELIVDTLATAYRAGAEFHDVRLAAVATAMGVTAESPVASISRAQRPEAEVTRENTLLLTRLFRHAQDTGAPLAGRQPEELKPDAFGLQRSLVRVEAAQAPRVHENPGPYAPGGALAPGMEVVVSPEIDMDPNEVIAALTRAGLNYSEKLTRATSVVVCNRTNHLRGKAMHARRKNIPLLSDTAFMEAVARVQAA